VRVEIEVCADISDALIDRLWDMEQKVFRQPYSREKLSRTLFSKQQVVCLIANCNGRSCGFKVGYEMSDRLFYSWIGGVIPEYRRLGIARKMMDKQHALVFNLGYEVVRTHTENKYREMLLLNIRSGFDVVGVINDLQRSKSTIVLDKILAVAPAIE